jgi:RNA 3'-terminal phosphate cyclase (ATP)
MILIDGQQGEGGGQILRGALALAAATGRGFRIERIRAGRARPGLMRQHLTAVQAARAICDAEVVGAALGSTTLEFRPGPARAGDHDFDIGSAGSASLVLQAVVPALARLAAPSTIAITGGTHNPFAPPFDFLRDALAPQLAAIGWSLELAMPRAGFYPAGGGRVVARIGAVGPVRPLVLVERGPRTHQVARVVIAHLPRHVAARELALVLAGLTWPEADGQIVHLDDCAGPGNYVAIELGFARVTELLIAIGDKQTRAEQVAAAALTEARAYLRSTAPVGEHLCDQLLVPLALAAGGELRAVTWSAHAEAQRALLRTWFGRDVIVDRADDGVRVTVPAMT